MAKEKMDIGEEKVITGENEKSSNISLIVTGIVKDRVGEIYEIKDDGRIEGTISLDLDKIQGDDGKNYIIKRQEQNELIETYGYPDTWNTSRVSFIKPKRPWKGKFWARNIVMS